jgi:hypothetical protein
MPCTTTSTTPTSDATAVSHATGVSGRGIRSAATDPSAVQTSTFVTMNGGSGAA